MVYHSSLLCIWMDEENKPLTWIETCMVLMDWSPDWTVAWGLRTLAFSLRDGNVCSTDGLVTGPDSSFRAVNLSVFTERLKRVWHWWVGHLTGQQLEDCELERLHWEMETCEALMGSSLDQTADWGRQTWTSSLKDGNVCGIDELITWPESSLRTANLSVFTEIWKRVWYWWASYLADMILYNSVLRNIGNDVCCATVVR